MKKLINGEGKRFNYIISNFLQCRSSANEICFVSHDVIFWNSDALFIVLSFFLLKTILSRKILNIYIFAQSIHVLSYRFKILFNSIFITGCFIYLQHSDALFIRSLKINFFSFENNFISKNPFYKYIYISIYISFLFNIIISFFILLLYHFYSIGPSLTISFQNLFNSIFIIGCNSLMLYLSAR